MAKNTYPSIQLFNLSLFSSPKSELLNILNKSIKEGKSCLLVATPNPEQIVQAAAELEFQRNLSKIDLLLPDGVGLIWASQILSLFGHGQALKSRITGREIVTELLKSNLSKNNRVLVLGGRAYPGQPVNSNFESLTLLGLKQIHQGKNQFYWLEAYQDKARPSSAEEDKVSQVIKELKPKLVLVSLGAPEQENWLINHKQLLDSAEVKVAMAVGGSIDYILGVVPQTPRFISQIGLEWFFRLLTQPWRWRRQLRLVKFVGLLIEEMKKNRGMGK